MTREERIAALEDELHAMRSEQQALLALNAVRAHHLSTMRQTLVQTQSFVNKIKCDWGLATAAEVVRRTKQEAQAIEGVISEALALQEPPRQTG